MKRYSTVILEKNILYFWGGRRYTWTLTMVQPDGIFKESGEITQLKKTISFKYLKEYTVAKTLKLHCPDIPAFMQ